MTAAVLDACVLYSAYLRDLFMRPAVAFVFQPKWTPRIHEEWTRNVFRNRPDLTPVQLERTRALMDRWGGDWAADGYEKLIPAVTLPASLIAPMLSPGAPTAIPPGSVVKQPSSSVTATEAPKRSPVSLAPGTPGEFCVTVRVGPKLNTCTAPADECPSTVAPGRPSHGRSWPGD